MGRVFCSIIKDTSGWHDTVCGNTTKKIISEKWGERRYQQYGNEWQQSGYDSFLVEVAKYGMGKRDLAANLNLFSKVSVDELGNLQFDSASAKPGAFIDLRFEMDTLVVFHTCPHPLNPAAEYPRKPVSFQIRSCAAANESDPCRKHSERHDY